MKIQTISHLKLINEINNSNKQANKTATTVIVNKDNSELTLISHELSHTIKVVDKLLNYTAVKLEDLTQVKNKISNLSTKITSYLKAEDKDANLKTNTSNTTSPLAAFLQLVFQFQQLNMMLAKNAELRSQELSDLSNTVNAVLGFLTNIAAMYQDALSQKNTDLAKNSPNTPADNSISWQENLANYLSEFNKAHSTQKYQMETDPHSNVWMLVVTNENVPLWVREHLNPALQNQASCSVIDVDSLNTMAGSLMSKIGSMLDVDLSGNIKAYSSGCSTNTTLNAVIEFFRTQLQAVNQTQATIAQQMQVYQQNLNTITSQFNTAVQLINQAIH